jgi:HAD superfamily hydrolase (TIGR01509 family)
MTIRALIFDFDGLILDTETPEVKVWEAIYAEHGQDYPLEKWSQIVGGWGVSSFDPADELHRRCGDSIDPDALRDRHREESSKLILNSAAMKGVHVMLHSAQQLGLPCIIASSSERSWVVPHLERLGLREHFDPIITGDDVPKGRTKPHPHIFLKALESIPFGADEVVVLEDSPNGITAAHAAGLRVVGVPNPVTAGLQLDADLLLTSLDALPLAEILQRIEALALPRGRQRSSWDAPVE